MGIVYNLLQENEYYYLKVQTGTHVPQQWLYRGTVILIRERG
jgi:hypothetical protein